MKNELIGKAVANLAEFVGRAPTIEVRGALNIAMAQDWLQNGGSVLILFLPHTHVLDPIVLNEVLIRPEFTPFVTGQIGIPASIKFTRLIPEMDTMGIATLGSDAYAKRSGFELVPVFQPYLLNDPRFAHLTTTADKINLHALLRMKRILATPSSMVVIAPEGTRNRSGGLLKADQNISGLTRSKNAKILYLPISINGMYAQSANLLAMLRADVQIDVGEPLTKDMIAEIQGGTRWEDQTQPPFSEIDAIMLYAARNLPLKPLLSGVDPRGIYSEVNVGSK